MGLTSKQSSMNRNWGVGSGIVLRDKEPQVIPNLCSLSLMRGLFRISPSQQRDKSWLVFFPDTAKLSGEGLFGVLEAELTSFEM